MDRVRKFLASPLGFKCLLAEALVRLGMASTFRLLPLPRRAQFLMRGYQTSSRRHRTAPSSEEICRAVEVAARFLPGATCVVKAQVGCAMLNRLGHAAEVRIGVSKKMSGIEAHAWVECDGAVVIGDSRNRYVQLQNVEGTAGRRGLPRT